jgi:hypothetical protein
MPKDGNIKSNPPRAVTGVASVLGTTSAPPIMAGGTHAGSVACDSCNLNLPRSATHLDVTSHPCYRGFSISLTAAGQISLA